MLLRRILQIVSWVALAGTIAPAVVFLAGHMTMGAMQAAMLVATVVWFAATPLGHWGRLVERAQ